MQITHLSGFKVNAGIRYARWESDPAFRICVSDKRTGDIFWERAKGGAQ